MRDLDKHTCRIALVQAEPVLFNKQESLKKALGYIEEAAKNKAELIVFPELFIPGYPVGLNFGFSVGKRTESGREDWKRYYDAENDCTKPGYEWYTARYFNNEIITPPTE